MLDKFFLEKYTKLNNIPAKPRAVLTEYLQSEVLFVLYGMEFGKFLTFMGGTSLRFVYGIERFSEDLDFELIKKKLDYKKLALSLEKELEKLGFTVETRIKKTPNIFIIFVKFSGSIYQVGLSPFPDQKIKIKFKIDPNPPKKIIYTNEKISAYGKTFNVITNTLSTIFAQKIIAIKMRPYQKGRDFYDLIWLLAQKNLEPNYALLREMNIKVKNKNELIKELKKIIADSDLKEASRDVERFLFNPQQAKWILDLPKYLKTFAD